MLSENIKHQLLINSYSLGTHYNCLNKMIPCNDYPKQKIGREIIHFLFTALITILLNYISHSSHGHRPLKPLGLIVDTNIFLL